MKRRLIDQLLFRFYFDFDGPEGLEHVVVNTLTGAVKANGEKTRLKNNVAYLHGANTEQAYKLVFSHESGLCGRVICQLYEGRELLASDEMFAFESKGDALTAFMMMTAVGGFIGGVTANAIFLVYG